MASFIHRPVSRRTLLGSGLAAAAVPLLSAPAFAAVPGDNRLIVILLRGGMDGLDLVQPYGDAAFAALRPTLSRKPADGLLDLDGFFGLHPAAGALMPLWQARELVFVHAVSTSYRSERPDHIEAQDLLEAGGMSGDGPKTGWLNRALSSMPRPTPRKALDLNPMRSILLTGPNDPLVGSATHVLPIAGDERQFLERLFSGDEAFARALSQMPSREAERQAALTTLLRQVATRLSDDARIATFSMAGWDSHVNQKTVFAAAASDLAVAIDGLKSQLGDIWKSTTVLALTEFGRTAAETAQGGTDHGAGSLAIVAGGTLSGGRVIADWPGLGPDRLEQGRALMPTRDVRAIAAALLHRQFDVSLAHLGSRVFPGLDMDQVTGFLQI